MMATAKELLARFETALIEKERLLLLQEKRVKQYLLTRHSSEDTEKVHIQINQSSEEISEILASLLGSHTLLAEFKTEANALCQRCRELKSYTNNMQDILLADLAMQKKDEKDEKIDVVKNATFLVAMPAAFVGLLKGGVGEGYVTSSQAALAGGVFGTSILLRKSLMARFKRVTAEICGVPQQVKESFLLYYFKEASREQIKIATTKMQQTYRHMAHYVSRKILTERTKNWIKSTQNKLDI